MTMPALSALLQAHEDVEIRADYRAGLLASLLFNANRGEESEPMHPHDFFPSLPTPRKPRKKPEDIVFGQLCALASGDQIGKPVKKKSG